MASTFQFRRDVIASIPALELAELFYATDELTWYVGTASGNKRLTRLLANAQTGTTYTVVRGDYGAVVSFDNASGVAVTLTDAETAGFEASWWSIFVNLGDGDVTITPSSCLVNGDSSPIVLETFDWCLVRSDGTDYVALLVQGGSGIGGSTGSTDNALLRADGTGGSTLQATGITVDDSDNVVGINAMDFRQHKNALINGAMDVFQRGTTLTSSDTDFGPDRFQVMTSSGVSVTITQETSSPPDKFLNYTNVQYTSGKTGFSTKLEQKDVVRLFDGGNGTVSLSFYAKISTGTPTFKAVVLAWAGTADSPTDDIVSSWGSDGTTPTWATSYTAENTPADLGITTSWQRFTIEGIALDTPSTTNLAVFIWVDDSTTAILSLTGVQLERGDKATEFEFRHYAEELLLCRRYCKAFVNDATATNAAVGPGAIRQSIRADCMVLCDVPMRVVPSLTVTASDWQIAGGTTFDITAMVVATGQSTTEVVHLNCTISGATAGEGCFLRADGTTTRRLILDAEL